MVLINLTINMCKIVCDRNCRQFFLMKSRFFRARDRARNRYVFCLLCINKTITITVEYNPAFDAGLSSTKEFFAIN